MCRWLAYSGGSIHLDEVIFKPEHSLIDQSLHSNLGANTTSTKKVADLGTLVHYLVGIGTGGF
jgi:hypothetical protein